MPNSVHASGVSAPRGGRPADDRRKRAGDGADDRSQRRSPLERRVDEQVGDERHERHAGGQQVGGSREDEQSRDRNCRPEHRPLERLEPLIGQRTESRAQHQRVEVALGQLVEAPTPHPRPAPVPRSVPSRRIAPSPSAPAIRYPASDEATTRKFSRGLASATKSLRPRSRSRNGDGARSHDLASAPIMPGMSRARFAHVTETGAKRSQRQDDRAAEHQRPVDDVRRVDDRLETAQYDERSEHDLQTQGRGQEHRGTNQLHALRVAIEDVQGRGNHGDGHEERTDAMGEVNGDAGIPERRNDVSEGKWKCRDRHPRIGVPHRRAQDDLCIHERRCQHGQASQHPIVDWRGRRAPAGRGDLATRQRQAEKYLREAGVADRHGGRQAKKNGDASQQALQHDRTQARPGEPAYPSPRFDPPRPDRKDDGQEADRAGDEPMRSARTGSPPPICSWGK